MKIYSIKEIEDVLNLKNNFALLLDQQKEAFIAYSNRQVIIPMPLQLSFEEPRGDCHIKAGYGKGRQYFTIKIANSLYGSKELRISPVSDGLLLILSQKTGKIEAILRDEGLLTRVRTALAVCIAAEETPFSFESIGIIGTGQQAQICLKLLSWLYPSKKFSIWGRNFDYALAISQNFIDIDIQAIKQNANLKQTCELIITATASHEPIFHASELQNKKTHIIALGADEKGKHEIDPHIFEIANKIIVDSLIQAQEIGDTAYAIGAGLISKNSSKIVELGRVLRDGYTDKDKLDLIITDLTGIAAQDIFLGEWVYHNL